MPQKAVDARKRFDRNRRFRGHGPLLQKAWSLPRRLAGTTAPDCDARARSAAAGDGCLDTRCRGVWRYHRYVPPLWRRFSTATLGVKRTFR